MLELHFLLLSSMLVVYSRKEMFIIRCLNWLHFVLYQVVLLYFGFMKLFIILYALLNLFMSHISILLVNLSCPGTSKSSQCFLDPCSPLFWFIIFLHWNASSFQFYVASVIMCLKIDLFVLHTCLYFV